MEICRACGQSDSGQQDEDEIVRQLTDIYHKLTGIQGTEVGDPRQMVFCGDCTDELNHFDQFRKKCLEVYERLNNVKLEVWPDDASLLVQIKVENEDFKSENEEKLPWKETPAKKPTKKLYKDKAVVQKAEFDDEEDCAENDEDDSEDEGEDGDFDALANDDSDDDGDDNVYDIKEPKSETDKEFKQPKKRIRTKNNGDGPRPKGRPRIHPVNPNKKPPMKFINCPKCPAKFFYEHRLEAHLRVHDGLKPFLCKLCGKSFITYRNIKTHHIQKHTDKKIAIPCEFPGCDAVFATKEGVKRHRQRNHDPNYEIPEQIPFICDTCGNSYTTNAALKRHKFSHNPEQMPFHCSFCPKKFPTKTKLLIHTKRHQGILDFECPHCGLKKPSKHEVRQHIKNVHEKHERTEPIACNVCQTLFSSKAGLKRHVDVVHMKIKKFSCTICGFMFSQKDHLNRHMKSHKRQGDIASLPIAVPSNINSVHE